MIYDRTASCDLVKIPFLLLHLHYRHRETLFFPHLRSFFEFWQIRVQYWPFWYRWKRCGARDRPRYIMSELDLCNPSDHDEISTNSHTVLFLMHHNNAINNNRNFQNIWINPICCNIFRNSQISSKSKKSASFLFCVQWGAKVVTPLTIKWLVALKHYMI